MKKNNIRMSVLLLTAALCFVPTSCKKESVKETAPEKVLQKAFSALQKNDYSKFMTFLYMSEMEREETLEMIEFTGSEAFFEWAEDIKSYDIVDSKTNAGGDRAAFKLRVVYNDNSESTYTIRLYLSDGIWEIEPEDVLDI